MKYLLVVVMVIFAMVLLDLYWRFRNRRSIRAGAREARRAERERKAEIKRLAKQAEIGDPIFRMLENAWRLAGSPSDRKISRNSNHDGAYQIEVNLVNAAGAVDRIASVNVDSRLGVILVETFGEFPKHHIVEFSKHRVIWKTKYILDREPIFKT